MKDRPICFNFISLDPIFPSSKNVAMDKIGEPTYIQHHGIFEWIEISQYGWTAL